MYNIINYNTLYNRRIMYIMYNTMYYNSGWNPYVVTYVTTKNFHIFTKESKMKYRSSVEVTSSDKLESLGVKDVLNDIYKICESL